MPRYSYTCTSCGNSKEAFHSPDERLFYCDICDDDTLKKNLTIPNIVKQAETNNLTNNKNGAIVKEKIEEYRKDLKEQKKELKNRDL
jgi:putative FmdB family regulatory protein